MDASAAPDEQQRDDDPATQAFLRHGGTVYTAVSADYDLAPLAFEPELNVKRDVRFAPPGVDGRLWNREQKLMRPSRNGLWSVYLDGSLSPKVPLREHVEGWLGKAEVALFKHPHRTCAYAEIDACVARKKIEPEEAEKARGALMLSGFPRDFGLWALGMIARRVHANALQRFAFPMAWEMVQVVPRDQIWFPFCLWKLKHALARIHTIDADIFDNRFFSFRRHGT